MVRVDLDGSISTKDGKFTKEDGKQSIERLVDNVLFLINHDHICFSSLVFGPSARITHNNFVAETVNSCS